MSFSHWTRFQRTLVALTIVGFVTSAAFGISAVRRDCAVKDSDLPFGPVNCPERVLVFDEAITTFLQGMLLTGAAVGLMVLVRWVLAGGKGT